jgi:O-antigen/teichoic acid export membrane protein
MGKEDFRFITIRSIIIKFIYLLCIFIYVRNALDYKIYYILSAATVIANAVVDIIYIRKFVHFSLPSIDIRPYYKAFFIMGAYVLLTNVYISLNPVWLGFVTNTDEVGYYTTATKLYNFIMAFLLSFTNILYPRVSNLLADGKREEYWQKIKIAFEAIYLFAFPTIIFMMVAGPQLLHLIVGDGFEGAYLPFRIITPLILIVGIEQILVIHILMATHSDNIVLRNSLIGAITTMVFNILLTSHLGAVGSAFVWIIVETLIMILSFIAIRHQFKFLFDYKGFFFYCINYTPLFLLSVFLYRLLENDYAIIVSTAVLTVIYAIINEIYFMKNQVALQLLQSLKHRM